MKHDERRLLPRFEPVTRFDVRTTNRAAREAELEDLKNKLLRQFMVNATGVAANTLFRRAAMEAAALAWVTPYPLLVFPVLFEEKADQARQQMVKQAQIRHRSRALMLEAV